MATVLTPYPVILVSILAYVLCFRGTCICGGDIPANVTRININHTSFINDGNKANISTSSIVENNTNVSTSRTPLDPTTQSSTEAGDNYTEASITSYDPYYRFLPNKSERFLATDVTKFVCGTSKLCQPDTNMTEYGLYTFECPDCQCDEMCRFYGDCCPDLLFQDSVNIPPVPFPYLKCVAGFWTTWANDSDVFMVSQCPDNPLDKHKDTLSKCNHPDKHYRDQATPVSVIDFQVTYRNIYCAKCHGVTDTKPWRHQVKCDTDAGLSKATTREELWKLVLNSWGCKVTSFPPFEVATRPCYPASIGTCNVTGGWISRIPMVEHICGLFSHTSYYYGSSSHPTSYTNIFCAICNGAILNRAMPFSRVDSGGLPLPLSVLLDFNSEDDITQENEMDIFSCEKDQVFDPFLRLCRGLACSPRRVLVDGECDYAFSAAKGLGFSFSVIISPNSGSLNSWDNGFATRYVKELRAILAPFSPFIFSPLVIQSLHKYEDEQLLPVGPGIEESFPILPEISAISVFGQVVTTSERNLKDMEQTLKDIPSLTLIYFKEDNNITMSSAPVPCYWGDHWMNDYLHVGLGFNQIDDPPTLLDSHCDIFDCLEHLAFPRVENILDCAFLEYNLTVANFTYYHQLTSLEYDNHTIYLNGSRLLYCGETLQLCSDLVTFIQTALEESNNRSGSKKFYKGTSNNLAMALVSLVCISLSLVGLSLTFVIYCVIPQLRTVPGKNTMALVFHLFFAQLFFLTGTSWTDNVVLCQAVGVTIHYFWLVAFAWMSISAYHMHKVFTGIAIARDSLSQSKRLVRYALFCNLTPIIIILSCITYHLSISGGSEMGYGGDVCFLKDSNILIAFFIAPLGLMILCNMIWFVRTIMAIRNVPDMKEVSNRTNRQHVYVYIKLSFLFGFTWVFGIVAAIFQFDVLWYLFIVLTGSQGLLIFMAYCANKRIWKMLKAMSKGKQPDIYAKTDSNLKSAATSFTNLRYTN